MNADGIWKLFCETGNLSCYLMYKELARNGQNPVNNQEHDKPGQTGNKMS